MIKKLIAFLAIMPLSAMAINFAKDDYKMVYLVSIGGHETGVVYISKDDKLLSKYHALDKSDRFPFFAKEKSVELDGKTRMIALKAGQHDLSLHYDLRKVDKIQLRRAGVSERDIENTVMVINKKKDKPVLTFKKAPAVNLEVLIIGLLTNSLENHQNFLLYEPQNRKIIRAKLVKGGKKQTNFQGRNCTVNEYVVYIMKAEKQGKPLMKISMVGTMPVQIKAASGRWALELRGLGPEEMQIEPLLSLAGKTADSRLSQKKGIKVTARDEGKADSARHHFLFNYQIARAPRKNDLARYAEALMALELFAAEGKGQALSYSRGKYVLRVPHSKICNYLRAKNQGSKYDANCRMEYSTVSSFLEFGELNKQLYNSTTNYHACGLDINSLTHIKTPYCFLKTNEESITVKPLKMAEDYFIALGKNPRAIRNVTIDGAGLTINWQKGALVSADQLESAGMAILAKKLGAFEPAPIPSKIVSTRCVAFLGCVAKISGAVVQQGYCDWYAKTYFAANKAAFKEGACQFVYQEKVNIAQMLANVKENVYAQYPEHKIMGTDVKLTPDGQAIQYEAVKGYGGSQHACFK